MGAAARMSRTPPPCVRGVAWKNGNLLRGKPDGRLGRPSRAKPLGCGLLVAILVAGGGCRAGGGSSLSWWPGSAENSRLAASDGEREAVPKPSETYPPYPTTSTPEGYGSGAVVPASAESAAGSAASASESAGSGPGEGAAVTYGKEPPAQVGLYQAYPSTGVPPAVLSPPEVIQTEPAAPAAAFSSAAPGAMAGGTSAWSGRAAGTGSAGPASPLPVESGGAGTTGFRPTGPDSSPSGVAAAAQTAGSPFPPSAPTREAGAADGNAGDRYAVATGSRFSGGSGSPAASMQPAWAPTQPTGGLGPAAAEGLGPPTVPAVGGPATQSGTEGFVQPPPVPGQPGRRPDPKYRPGGTSTYRPAQAILDPSGAEEGLAWGAPAGTGGPPAPQAVIPAGYQGVPASGQLPVTSP